VEPGTRKFDQVKRRYKEFTQIDLTRLSSWQDVEHARELRNALVHNLGLYTTVYLKTQLARHPVMDDDTFFLPDTDEGLVGLGEAISLDREFSEQVIAGLLVAGKEIDDALHDSR
jgi:hypothetical protein